MQIDVKKNAMLILLLLFGLGLIWAGALGRVGAVMGAVFTPEYLVVASAESSSSSSNGSGSGSGSGGSNGGSK